MGLFQQPAERRFFRGKKVPIVLIAVYIALAFGTMQSLDRAATSVHDPVDIYGLSAGCVLCAAIALISTVLKERILFGAASGAAGALAVLAIELPGQQIMHLLRWFELLMYLIVIAASVLVVLERPKESDKHLPGR